MESALVVCDGRGCCARDYVFGVEKKTGGVESNDIGRAVACGKYRKQRGKEDGAR